MKNGARLRLVGIEYVIPIFQDGRPFFGPGAPANPGPVPTLFGQRFDGPMAGHNPAMPWHHDLHVWMYRENPAGYFAQLQLLTELPLDATRVRPPRKALSIELNALYTIGGILDRPP